MTEDDAAFATDLNKRLERINVDKQKGRITAAQAMYRIIMLMEELKEHERGSNR